MSKLIDGMIKMEMDRDEKARFNEIKRRRFETSARLLSGKQIMLSLIHSSNGYPASYDLAHKFMELNESVPKVIDEVKRLIFDRAKLFHELGHALFTEEKVCEYRRILMQASPDPAMFLDVSNILEDGRIEWLLAQKWNGVTAYIRSLVRYFHGLHKKTPRACNALVFYVRFRKWPSHSDYWKPVLPLIDKAIRSLTCRGCCLLADQIVRQLTPQNPRHQPQPPLPPGPTGEGGEGTPGGEGTGVPGEGEGTPGQEKSPDEASGGQQEPGEGKTGEGEGAGTSPGNPEGKGDSKEGEESGEGAGGDLTEKELNKLVNEIEKQGFTETWEKGEQEQESLLQELNAPGEQPLRDGEEMETQMLATLLASIIGERNRNRMQPVKKYGRIDGRRLVGVVSGDSFLRQALPKPCTINVALLIDCSGSMGGRGSYSKAENAGHCGRVINGALQRAKINSLVVSFHSYARQAPCVPLKGFDATGGTNTAGALNVALEWLSNQEGKGIIFILTDGVANDIAGVCKRYQEAKKCGHSVVGVMIGMDYYSEDGLQCATLVNDWSDEHFSVAADEDFLPKLEAKLIALTGQF